jgi:hypothetical protein
MTQRFEHGARHKVVKRETRIHKAPGNWARGHCPQSYGKRGYKEGHVPIGRLETKVIWGDNCGRQI